MMSFTPAQMEPAPCVMDGIHVIEPGFYNAKSTVNKGQTPIYFGCEKIETDEQVNYWKTYTSRTNLVAGKVVRDLEKSFKGDKKFLSEEQLKRLAPLHAVRNPASLTSELCQVSSEVNQVYMIYISKLPITQKLTQDTPILPEEEVSREEFQAKYGHLLMSCTLLTKPDSKTTTHIGIFKNLLDLVNPTKKYLNLANRVHEWGGIIAETQMKETSKQFMVNSPLDIMKSIMTRKFGAPSPVFRCDGKYKIAKPGVEVSEKTASLSDEDAAVIADNRRQINHAPNVGGDVAFPIERLVNSWRKSATVNS